MEKKRQKKKYVENSVSDTHWCFLSKGTYALNRSSDFFGKVCYVGQLRRLLTAGGLLYIGLHCCRLRVITNLGDVDSGRGGGGGGEQNTHVHAKFRGDATRRELLFFTRLLSGVHFRSRACISPESPKLDTTRSLALLQKGKKKMEVEELLPSPDSEVHSSTASITKF